MYSNIRLLDCINQPKDLINRALEIGLAGICCTDHEALGAHVTFDKLRSYAKEKDPDFKIGLGNEIYLVNERVSNQKYWHFILIAKDFTGYKALRELSSTSWQQSYFDRGMERVPTLKTELAAVVQKYGKGHIIASSACLGSELDYHILEFDKADKLGNVEGKTEHYYAILNFIDWARDLFGEDFYLEVQPAQSKEQMIVNRRMKDIAEALNMKVIVTTDAHYLSKGDRWVHKAYLNSKQGDREVDEFYEYAYLQTTEEVIANLEGTGLDYKELEKNTLEIYEKIEEYSLARKQRVPQVEVPDYPKKDHVLAKPTLEYLYTSDNPQERYWVNYCMDQLRERDLYNEEYISRLEEEARIKKIIGDKLGTCMFAYPIFLQHYINRFWDIGSTVGAGRGSACAGLNHWLLGVTQLDPIKWDLPF